MEINLYTEKTIDAFSTPLIEWKSKNLTFYRTYNQKSMILRLPDGCYIEED